MSDGCISTSIWEGNPAWLQPNFCASLYTSGLVKPRGLHIGSNNEILLVERGRSRVVRLDNDGADIVPVAAFGSLNHGIELANGYLYASTPTTVYRWPYQTGQTTAGNADNVEEVIVGMGGTASNELGAPGGHTTRTLAFDAAGQWLYVSIGSLGNVDSDSSRSRIRRFDIAAWDASQPLVYNDGEVFADGLRNEVGLAFDSHGDLWGVENGADRLYRDDLGGSIVNDNPSEELNRFQEAQAGEHWGYPYCWSEYCLPVEDGGSGMKGANTQWAWPSFIDEGYTDKWCRENTISSVMSMPAHSAPLGITFYNWKDMSQEDCVGGFPKSMDKYAFIAFHGSWNRSPPTGYKVVYVPFDGEGNPTALPIDLFRHNGNQAKWPDPLRPVDVQFDKCGRFFVTEDGTGSVIKITYSGGYEDDFVPIETDVADGAPCTPFQLPTTPPSKPPTVPPTSSILDPSLQSQSQVTPNETVCEEQTSAFIPIDGCRGYVRCVNGNQVAVQSCVAGMLFDSTINQCNWEPFVTCTTPTVPSQDAGNNTTYEPTLSPSHVSSVSPTAQPTNRPEPTLAPSGDKTNLPSTNPSMQSSRTPTKMPSAFPTAQKLPSAPPTSLIDPTSLRTPSPTVSPTDYPSYSPFFAPSAAPSTNQTLATTRNFKQILEIEEPEELREVQVGIYQLLMQYYTSKFGYEIGPPHIVTECRVIEQNLSGTRRELSDSSSKKPNFHQVSDRHLQGSKFFVTLAFTMRYESRFGYAIEDYPEQFQNYVNSNLEMVDQDLAARYLPVIEAQDVVIFSQDPTLAPSQSADSALPSISPTHFKLFPGGGMMRTSTPTVAPSHTIMLVPPATNGTQFVKDKFEQLLQIQQPAILTQAQVWSYQLLMQGYTPEFGYLLGEPDIVATCDVVEQSFAQAKRVLTGADSEYANFQQVSGRHLEDPPAHFLLMTFTMQYKSQSGYDIVDYPEQFQNYVNNNLEKVTQDMMGQFLPVIVATEVVALRQAPTLDPSTSVGNLSSSPSMTLPPSQLKYNISPSTSPTLSIRGSSTPRPSYSPSATQIPSVAPSSHLGQRLVPTSTPSVPSRKPSSAPSATDSPVVVVGRPSTNLPNNVGTISIGMMHFLSAFVCTLLFWCLMIM